MLFCLFGLKKVCFVPNLFPMYLIHDFVGMIKSNKGIYISALMGRLLKRRTLVWVQTCLCADLALCAAAISSAYPAYVAGYTCRIKYSTTLFLSKTLCAYFFSTYVWCIGEVCYIPQNFWQFRPSMVIMKNFINRNRGLLTEIYHFL